MKLSQVILYLYIVLLLSCRESIVKSKETLPIKPKEQPIHTEPEKHIKRNEKSIVVDTLKPKIAIKSEERSLIKSSRNTGC